MKRTPISDKRAERRFDEWLDEQVQFDDPVDRAAMRVHHANSRLGAKVREQIENDSAPVIDRVAKRFSARITPSWFTDTRRKAAYRVAGAVVGLASVYGVVTGEEAAAFGLLFAALFGIAQDNVT